MRLLFALLLMLFSVDARAEWLRADSPNLTVYGNTSVANLRAFALRVERFDALLHSRMSSAVTKTDGNKLTIFILADQAEVQRSRGDTSGMVAGYYSANIFGGAYAVVPEPDRRVIDSSNFSSWLVLNHEYTHHFMLQYLTIAYPAWFVEGFAEFYATADFNKDGSIGVGAPPYNRGYSLIALGPMPLSKLFAADREKMDGAQTDLFYGTSWLLTHYFMMDPERKKKFNQYLLLYAQGEDHVKAAQTAFGDLAVLQADLKKYLNANSLLKSVIKMPSYVEPTVTITPLDAPQASMMSLRLRFTTGSDSKEQVASFLADAIKAQQKFPNHPEALEYLAEGQLGAENLDAATKANEALLALQPNNARALLRTARIASARLTAKDGKYEGGWPAIRKLIVKANRAAPNDPFPLFEYFNTYSRDGIKPPPLAALGIERAVQLAPQVKEIRLTLGSYFMAETKKEAARFILEPLLNDPHDPQLREFARNILDPKPTPSKDAPPPPEKAKGQ